MEDDASDYSPAEQRLVDAIAAGAVCDFADGAEITADEMASWGRERTIRATVLRQLLTAEDAQNSPNGVLLRGAVIKGILNIKGISAVQFDLQHCQIATIEASGAIFTGDASFNGAIFTGDASFADATFTRHARFTDATFTSDARFTDATFTGYAWFNGATFTSDARFTDATFTGYAWFNGATFTSRAWFTDATFTSDARFTDAIADAYDFSRAQFHTTDPGPWVARQVTLTVAVFHVRARLAVAAAAKCDCRRLQAREGVTSLSAVLRWIWRMPSSCGGASWSTPGPSRLCPNATIQGNAPKGSTTSRPLSRRNGWRRRRRSNSQRIWPTNWAHNRCRKPGW